jgi:serine/threonine protein kinase
MSHPNILPVYDSGAVDGILYYVMPLVEGESLPDRLKREKQLPVSEALKIAREVAEALAYAHARGIVHRDIKPANILINAGHAMVADFGIARAADSAGQALTQTGLAIGTPQYMSPEQASGDPNVDGRADIYALGCVLYEMLAGEPPFTGPTSQAIIARALTETPRPLTQTRATLAPVVSAAVFTAMAKSPADRFATAGDMAAALSLAEDQTKFGSGAGAAMALPATRTWRSYAVAAVVLLALVFAGWRVLTGKGSGATAVRSVAVLPFVNQGPAERAYFADGIVDELRDKLARLDQLTVTASGSSDQYRATTKTLTDVARELHVDQLLTGKVSWGQGADGKQQVRVVTELVNGKTGDVTWRDTFSADTSDAFAIQGRIATSVATALGTKVQQDQAKELAGRPTKNNEAYDFYLKGQAVKSNSASDARAAANYYEQAVALDSNFARAWGALSVSLSTLYFNGTRDPVVGRRSKEALDHLLKLAKDSSGAHMVASNYYTNVANDPASSRREVNEALRLDSNNTWALIGAANADFAAGNYRSTFERLSRARKLDPRATGPLATLLQTQMYLGQYDEAVKTGEELATMPTIGPGAMEWIVASHLARGDTASARQVFQQFVTRVPVTELVSYFAGYNEMGLAFGPSERELLYRLTPAAFDNDRAWWSQSLATAYRQQGDLVHSRAYADSSLAISKQQSDAAPTDAQFRALYGVMLAYAGHAADAAREGEQALDDQIKANPKDPNIPYTRMQLVRIYLANGQLDKAMDQCEQLLSSQYYISRGWMKIDPTFKPLRGNARFQKMLAQPVNALVG